MANDRPQLFYGWIIVAVAFVSGAFGAGLAVWTPSVFVVPMTEELGWSRTEYFAALAIRALVVGAIAPLIGPWIDTRNGPRRLSLLGAIATGVSLAGLKYVETPLQFYLLLGVVGGVSMIGSGFILAQVVVPKWFIRKRGRALGIASVGSGLGPLLFPVSVQWLIAAAGWRDAWMVLGVVSVVVLVPLSFMVRTRPEDMGLLPDGETILDETTSEDRLGVRMLAEPNVTRQEALRIPAFWYLLLAFVIAGVGFQGFQPNWLPYLQDSGFTATTAALGISVYGACSSSARILWGTLAERYSVRHLLVIETMLTASTILLLIYVQNVAMLMVFMASCGLTMGGYFILQPLIMAEYFGRAHLGAVSSVIRPFMTASGAAGPLLFAGLYDAHGNYFWAFGVAMMSWVLAGFIFLLAKPPKEARAKF